jgi:hypothetical protein
MPAVMRTCTQCGRTIPSGSRCALHPARWRSGGTRAWREQRERILERDGYRCTKTLAYGERCPATTLLEVHHLYSGSVVNVPDDELVTVCRKHNPRGG